MKITNVQELIDALSLVEDKTLPVHIQLPENPVKGVPIKSMNPYVYENVLLQLS